jgi:four helix bundle protein
MLWSVMKYNRFEELPDWKAAINLAVSIYSLTTEESFKGHCSLRDQLERAAVSISNNFAEGFERGTTQEKQAKRGMNRQKQCLSSNG